MSLPLSHVELGDVIVLPDGRAMTARAKVNLPAPVGSMAGFVIAGELEVLLSVPVREESPVLVYVPIDYLPESAARARTAYEGAMSYWAPHLPALSGAMGELLYRVVAIRGSVDPIVIVYRGPEVIVFIRASYAHSDDLRILYMRRDVDNDVELDRHAGTVISPDREFHPDEIGVPIRVPQHVGAPSR
jgi:hypothetical protein